jgi:hypothetical protein
MFLQSSKAILEAVALLTGRVFIRTALGAPGCPFSVLKMSIPITDGSSLLGSPLPMIYTTIEEVLPTVLGNVFR